MNPREAASFCFQKLENAGYESYYVGGCVRDSLLGIEPHDFDLCTAATPEQTMQVFSQEELVLAGLKHGTVGVITPAGVVEITTFRTEGSYKDSRHPDSVCFVTDVDADLARRDFTVNAIAWSPKTGYRDPFGGRMDLQQRKLRAVGDARLRFEEDALRILRGVRFAVRFSLTPDPLTLEAMFSQSHRLEHLAAERIADELCKLLPLMNAQDLMDYGAIFDRIIPELGRCFAFWQHSSHHKHDVFVHTAHVLAACEPDLTLRWAALLHDIGKVDTFSLDEQGEGHFYGHAQRSAQLAEDVLRRLKLPTALREDVVFLVEKHMLLPQADRKLLRRWLSRFGQRRLQLLLKLQEADRIGTGTTDDSPFFREIEDILEQILQENACLTVKDLQIDGHDLMALGFQGKAIGQELARLLNLVLDEQIPNEREALLAATGTPSELR